MRKDIVTKNILKNLARDISRYILNIKIEDEITLLEKEFSRDEKREADIIFRSADDIIHIEVQNNNHPKMHHRMLRYYTDILENYDEFEIKQFLIYIGKEKLYMKDRIKRYNLDYFYTIIDMRDIPCDSFLKSDDPSAIVLAILCDFEGKRKEEVVLSILRKLKEISDEKEFDNYLLMIDILSENRDLKDEIKRSAKMLDIDIEKTFIYEEAMTKGMQKGIEKGIQKGLQEGLQKGLQEGIEKGKREEKIAIAKSLLELFDDEKIAEITRLDKSEIKKLRDNKTKR